LWRLQAAERRAHSNLGNAHIFLGEFERASEQYKRTLLLAQELGDRAVEAQVSILFVAVLDEKFPDQYFFSLLPWTCWGANRDLSGLKNLLLSPGSSPSGQTLSQSRGQICRPNNSGPSASHIYHFSLTDILPQISFRSQITTETD
jgi:hypothetical protein